MYHEEEAFEPEEEYYTSTEWHGSDVDPRIIMVGPLDLLGKFVHRGDGIRACRCVNALLGVRHPEPLPKLLRSLKEMRREGTLPHKTAGILERMGV